MDFIELEIDVQRNPKLVTRLVTTLGEGGGVLHVVESYKTLKEKLLWS